MNQSMLLKLRSHSVPSITPLVQPQPIHQANKSRFKKKQDYRRLRSNKLPVISLLNVKNKEEQQVNLKLKLIAERSMKKLQERYETIDRWKKKYIPDHLQKVHVFKPNFNQIFPDVDQQVQPEQQNPQEPPKEEQNRVQQKSQKLLPMISKQPFNQIVPDHREQGKRLQEQLLIKLQRNKRFHEIKNSANRMNINYFQSMDFVPLDKKRQTQFKQLLKSSSVKKGKLQNIFHQKSIPKDKQLSMDLIDKELTKKGMPLGCIDQFLIGRQKKNLPKIGRSQSIHEFRQQLMNQAVQQTPQGWDVPNDPQSPGSQQSLE